MSIELLEESQDNGKKVIPFNTGRVKIGIAYTPKLTPSQASCGSYHAKPKKGLGKWAGVSFLAVFALLIISARGA